MRDGNYGRGERDELYVGTRVLHRQRTAAAPAHARAWGRPPTVPGVRSDTRRGPVRYADMPRTRTATRRNVSCAGRRGDLGGRGGPGERWAGRARAGGPRPGRRARAAGGRRERRPWPQVFPGTARGSRRLPRGVRPRSSRAAGPGARCGEWRRGPTGRREPGRPGPYPVPRSEPCQEPFPRARPVRVPIPPTPPLPSGVPPVPGAPGAAGATRSRRGSRAAASRAVAWNVPSPRPSPRARASRVSGRPGPA